MAGGAARVDLGFLVFHQFGARCSMDEMTGSAAHLILGVTAGYAAAGGALIQVAGKTSVIGFDGRQFSWVPDIIG
jgi:hypothetical protein